MHSPFPSKPLFLHVCSASLLKTLWENENFSFVHSVFYPFENLRLSSAVYTCLEESKFCGLGKGSSKTCVKNGAMFLLCLKENLVSFLMRRYQGNRYALKHLS